MSNQTSYQQLLPSRGSGHLDDKDCFVHHSSPSKEDGGNNEDAKAVSFSLRDALRKEAQSQSFQQKQRYRQSSQQTPPQVVRKQGKPSEFKLKLLEACYLNGSVALWDPNSIDFHADEPNITEAHEDEEDSNAPRRCCC